MTPFLRVNPARISLIAALAVGLIGPALAQDSGNTDPNRALTDGILADLGVVVVPDPETEPEPDADATALAEATGEGEDMLTLTTDVLASLGVELGGRAPGELSLQELIDRALQEAEPDQYLEAILNEAASSGQIRVPEELQTADGGVDTQTLVTALVERSVEQGPDTVQPDIPGVQGADGARTYVVQPGDSLGGIAFRIYGRTSAFTRIFEANRDRLETPDRIQVGQTLRIPDAQ
ncbi:MAG: LysM peptidoglycan-binding domain-containing protein [Marinibacterium sp.]